MLDFNRLENELNLPQGTGREFVEWIRSLERDLRRWVYKIDRLDLAVTGELFRHQLQDFPSSVQNLRNPDPEVRRQALFDLEQGVRLYRTLKVLLGQVQEPQLLARAVDEVMAGIRDENAGIRNYSYRGLEILLKEGVGKNHPNLGASVALLAGELPNESENVRDAAAGALAAVAIGSEREFLSQEVALRALVAFLAYGDVAEVPRDLFEELHGQRLYMGQLYIRAAEKTRSRPGGETGWVSEDERAGDMEEHYAYEKIEKEAKRAPPWPATKTVNAFMLTRTTSESTGVPALYAEDVPGNRLSDILGWAAVNSKDPADVLPVFEGIRDGVIPASTQSGQSSGLEETAFQRLPEVQIRSGIGIVAAGLEGEEGLVYGLALLKKGRIFEERSAPVAFLTRDERQTVLLRAAGVGKGTIFQTDQYPGVAAGLEAAAEYLRGQGATTVIPLGVFEKVSLDPGQKPPGF